MLGRFFCLLTTFTLLFCSQAFAAQPLLTVSAKKLLVRINSSTVEVDLYQPMGPQTRQPTGCVDSPVATPTPLGNYWFVRACLMQPPDGCRSRHPMTTPASVMPSSQAAVVRAANQQRAKCLATA